MKFSVDRLAVVKMLKLARKAAPGGWARGAMVRVSACPARVFFETNQSTVGIEALVLEEGACSVPLGLLLKLLQSYHPQLQITIEADAVSLRMGTTTLKAISEYSPRAVAPLSYQVFPVTDLAVAGRSPPSPLS
jgi:hypothetical protein